MNSVEELRILYRFCREAGAKAARPESRRGLMRLGMKLAVLVEAAERRERFSRDRDCSPVSLHPHRFQALHEADLEREEQDRVLPEEAARSH
jgi:hypothetical protein